MNPQEIAFEQSRRDMEESSRCLLAILGISGIINREGRPIWFMDVGCGPGHLVELMGRLGFPAIGFDINYTGSNPYVQKADILGSMNQLDFLRNSELVTCWEVAEHLPPSGADRLCDILADYTKKSLFLSAAIPGQGGSGHLNEQPNGYWIEKLESRGMLYRHEDTKAVRATLGLCAPTAWWYPQNMMWFDAK